MEGGWPVLENHHLANAGCPILSLSCFPSLCPQGCSNLVFLPAFCPKSRIQFMICAYMCYIYIYTTGNIYIYVYTYIYIYVMYINIMLHQPFLSCRCIYIIIYIYTNPMMDGKRNPNVSLPRLPRAAKELEILQIPWTAVGHSDLSKLICGDGTCLRRV